VTPSHLGWRVGYQSTLKYQRIVAGTVRDADLRKAYGYVILRPDDSGHHSHYISCL